MKILLYHLILDLVSVTELIIKLNYPFQNMTPSISYSIRKNRGDVLLNGLIMTTVGLKIIYNFLVIKGTVKQLIRKKLGKIWEYQLDTEYCQTITEFMYGDDFNGTELKACQVALKQLQILFPNLTKFSIRNRELTFEMFERIIETNRLRDLDISFCQIINRLRFRSEHLAALSKLKFLQITGIRCRERDLANLLSHIKNLKTLVMRENVTSIITLKCFEHLPLSLESLTIDFKRSANPTKILQEFLDSGKCLINLRLLKIFIGEFCRFDYRLIELVMPNLVTLELELYSSTGKGVALPHSDSITRVTLTEVYTQRGKVFLDESLLLWTKEWGNLTELTLCGMDYLSKSGVTDKFLQYCHVYCKSLTDLKLRNLSAITDKGIFYLSYYDRLEKLTLRSVSAVTAKGVNELLNYKKLKELNVKYCMLMAIGDISLLEERVYQMNLHN